MIVGLAKKILERVVQFVTSMGYNPVTCSDDDPIVGTWAGKMVHFWMSIFRARFFFKEQIGLRYFSK